MSLIVAPLPATRQDLEAARVLKARPTVLDLVEPIMVALWENEEFKKLVDAINDADAVEGSVEIDDTMAAVMIRQYAIDHAIEQVRHRNLSTLRHALRLVLRRYNAGRKQRIGEENNTTEKPAA